MIRFFIGFMSLILTVGIVEGAESFTIANLSLIMTTTIVGVIFMFWGIKTSTNI